MNKIFYILLLLLFICCNKKSKYNIEVKIENLTKYSIWVDINVYSPSWEIDSINLLSINSSDSIILDYQSFGNYKSRRIGIDKLMVYNLIDTTSFDWLYFYDYRDIPLNIYKSSQEREDQNNYTYYKFIISNDLLTLFQKDTSMLTKFKDYYNK